MKALLEEQKAYYDARSVEYDEWWERRGQYDLGPDGNIQWKEAIQKVEAVFDKAPLGGQILEVAGGTGNWTAYLARRAERVTVLENSNSMIKLNRCRLQRAGLIERVEFEATDLFAWNPHGRYDCVFSGFWISHVPSQLLDPFLLMMIAVLKPGGCLVILEGEQSWRSHAELGVAKQLGTEIELRVLNDGRTFRVVKRYDDPNGLRERLKGIGLKPVVVGSCCKQFLYAVAHCRVVPHSVKR